MPFKVNLSILLTMYPSFQETNIGVTTVTELIMGTPEI